MHKLYLRLETLMRETGLDFEPLQRDILMADFETPQVASSQKKRQRDEIPVSFQEVNSDSKVNLMKQISKTAARDERLCRYSV